MRRTVALLLLSMAIAPALRAAPTTTLIYPPWKHCFGLHRVTQTHLTLRAGFRYKFDNPQGLAAVKLRAEDDTTSTRDDDELTVFGVNSGQSMLIYNTSLTAVAFYGAPGSGVGQFRDAHGIAAERSGLVVVADTGNDRLHVLQYEQDKLHHVRFIAGDFAGQPLRRPLGVALEAGEIYVCDSGNARVLVLDRQGGLRRVLAPATATGPFLHEPFAIAAIRAGARHNFFGEDFVVVTDSSHSRLVTLFHDGRVRDVRRSAELGEQVREFYYVALDLHANVYTSDRSGRLHKFDRKLRYLLSIGRAGRDEYEFDEPRGLGLYRRFGQLFVAERAGAHYFWTGTDVFSPRLVELQADANGVWSGTVRYFLTEYARVQLELVDREERRVVLLQKPRWQNVGAVRTRVTFQAPASDGPLRLRVEAVPTYSSRRHLLVRKLGPPLPDLKRSVGEP
ncbi:MAG: NHL repeat-containing protein [Candidatus Latescibacterota bacterium]|nr:MAG: NHL repeat-containing protein [Candidatus Latescibacterota bacterium]